MRAVKLSVREQALFDHIRGQLRRTTCVDTGNGWRVASEDEVQVIAAVAVAALINTGGKA